MFNGFDCFYFVERLCSELNVGKVLELVDEMWKIGKVFSLIVCSILVECLRKVGNIEDLLRLVDKMLKEGVFLDSVIFNCFF